MHDDKKIQEDVEALSLEAASALKELGRQSDYDDAPKEQHPEGVQHDDSKKAATEYRLETCQRIIDGVPAKQVSVYGNQPVQRHTIMMPGDPYLNTSDEDMKALMIDEIERGPIFENGSFIRVRPCEGEPVVYYMIHMMEISKDSITLTARRTENKH